MLGLFYPYGIVLQAIAILHFVRRRPDTFWLFVILIGGGLGSLVYIFVEVVPDVRLLHAAYQVFPRRKRIKQLEAVRCSTTRRSAISRSSATCCSTTGSTRGRASASTRCWRDRMRIDPLYRRALASLALDDVAAAAKDLEQVTAREPKYDYQRAAGLRAHALGRLGQIDAAAALFADVTSTLDADARPNTTTRRFSPRPAEPPRRASGPSVSCARRRRCPITSGGGNVRGSAAPSALLKRLPKHG